MNKNRHTPGQALLETALILPLILVIVLLFIDLGRITYYYSALNNAVREGARYATVHVYPSSSDRQTDIQQMVVGYAVSVPLDPNNVSIYCDQNQTNFDNPCTTYITVSAHVEIAPVVTFLARMMGSGNTYNITAQSTMQMTPYGNQ